MSNRDNGFDDDDEGFFASLVKRRDGVPMPESMAKMFKMIAAVIVIIVVGTVTYAVWPNGKTEATDSVPIVRADEGEYKVVPEDKGGMPIPNKDSTIFETMEKEDKADRKVENLLEDEEKPMTKDEAFQEDTPPDEPTSLAEATSAKEEVKETPAEKVEPKEEKVEAPKKPEAKPEKEASSKENIIDQLKEEAGTKEKDQVKPAAKTAGKGQVFIQLASVKSEAEAKVKWDKLKSSYPDLKSLSLKVQKADLGAKGIFYRVQAGPISAEKAGTLCGKIKAAGGGCLVAK